MPANIIVSYDGTANEDVITLGITSNNGVKVTLNGTTTNYQPGQWTDVTVNTRGANDTVTVTGSEPTRAVPNCLSKRTDQVG